MLLLFSQFIDELVLNGDWNLFLSERIQRKEPMLVIGLAGGVASGKSLVAKCFQHFGAEILDADRFGHEVLKDPSTIQAIVAQWGHEILIKGEVDRKALAKIVFESSEQGTKSLAILEQITHPKIGERIRAQLDELKSESKPSAVVLDAPVMFKAKWSQMCDKIVFVHADLSTRQQRARQRGWDDEELFRRESRQTPTDEKRSNSTDEIDNSQSREKTYIQAHALWVKWGLVFPKQLDSPTTLFEPTLKNR